MFASRLLVIQFCLKNDTKYCWNLNFSLTPCVHLVYSACSTHCSSLNKKNMVVDFMYKHVSCNDNFTFFVSHTLISSVVHSDLESVMMMMEQLTALIAQYLHCLSINAFHIAWGRIMRLPQLSLITISTGDVRRRCPRIYMLSMSIHISLSRYSEVSKMYEKMCYRK